MALKEEEVNLLRKIGVTEEIIGKCDDDNFKKHLWDMLDLGLSEHIKDFDSKALPYTYVLRSPLDKVKQIVFKRKPTILDYYQGLRSSEGELAIDADPTEIEIAHMVCQISDIDMEDYELLYPQDLAIVRHIYIVLREWPASKMIYGESLIETIYNKKESEFNYPIVVHLADPVGKPSGESIEKIEIRCPRGKDYIKLKKIESKKDKLEFIYRLVDIDRPYFENITLTDAGMLELLAGKFTRPFQKTGLMLSDI